MTLKAPHHTQTKLAAKLGVTIKIMSGSEGDQYALVSATDADKVISSGTDLKALLDSLVKANAPAKAPRKARKPAKAKRRARKTSDEDGEEGDEDEDGDEEEKVSLSVVKPKYKAKYRPHKDSNGDAMAMAFRAFVINEDGELDLSALQSVAQTNGLSVNKYTRVRNRGWQGRARMSIGNILRGMIRRGEDVTIGDKTFKGLPQKKAKD